jgi:hypothetical protein
MGRGIPAGATVSEAKRKMKRALVEGEDVRELFVRVKALGGKSRLPALSLRTRKKTL